jgi:hypothetical protein
MDNVTFFEGIDGVEMAIIDNADGSFTSMTKAHYEAQQAQAALSTPMVIDDPKS